MLPWVIANPGATVDEVCDRFGYTRSELVDDLNLVFVCGLPGYGPGDLMVAYIDEDEVVVEMADYFATPAPLSPAEALSLLASGLAIQSTGQAPPALVRAVQKLQDVLMPDGADALVVDLSEPDLASTLREAVVSGRVVGITYTSLKSGETTERDIEPWSVFSTLGNWYVSAFCRMAGEERVFRVDRIRSVTATDDRFDPPDEPPPPVVHYTPGEEDVRATIRLRPSARWVADYYPVDVLDDDGEDLVVRFSASDASVAGRLLVRLGGDAVLEEGQEVGAARDQLRSRILGLYGASPQ